MVKGRAPITFLTIMKDIDTTRPNMFKILQFPAKMDPQLRNLLFEKDERALWILGFWLGVMCRYKGVWWCEGRAKRDYAAVKEYLNGLQVENRPEPEGDRWRRLMSDLDEAPHGPLKVH